MTKLPLKYYRKLVHNLSDSKELHIGEQTPRYDAQSVLPVIMVIGSRIIPTRLYVGAADRLLA